MFTSERLKKIKFSVGLLLYVSLFTLLLPIFIGRIFWRARTAPEYSKNFFQRLGWSPDDCRFDVWVHAVSLGESMAIMPSLAKLMSDERFKSVALITNTTATGRAYVLDQLNDDPMRKAMQSYMPFDWPPFVLLFLLRVRPKVLIVVETELWPFTLWLCQLLKIRVVVVNARLSEKSFIGYQRFAWLTDYLFPAIYFAAQYQADADRFIALGANAAHVEVLGSVKFDVELDQANKQKSAILRKTLRNQNRFTWVAGSTHDGEETIIVDAHKALLKKQKGGLLILVPRHPERFDDVATLLDRSGLRYQCFSQGLSNLKDTNDIDILLVDTMGELLSCYGAANCAFIGGSLVPVGGHNFLEAAVWGIPTITGPHCRNFENIKNQLVEVSACKQIDDAKSLATVLSDYAALSEKRILAGMAAKRCVELNRGTSSKLVSYLLDMINDGIVE